jgi:HAD superfamily hydrolase (TIGR01509 family)
MITNIIFDMDGVLIDTEPIYINLRKSLFKKLGITLCLEEHHDFVGISPWKMWQILRERFKLSESIEQLVQIEKEEQYKKLRSEKKIEPIPGTITLLNSLKDMDKNLAIASSSSKKIVTFILDKLSFNHYFDTIVCGDQISEGKPAPFIFLKVANLMGVKPSDCVIIEDSKNGVTGANAAGMLCIAYQNLKSGRQDLSKAEMIVKDFSFASVQRILKLVKANG